MSISGSAGARWDDPFWHVVRMVVDETRGRVLSRQEIPAQLKKIGTEASLGLLAYLRPRPEIVERVADYLQFRTDVAASLLARMRTERQALDDFAELSSEVVQKYGTRSADHHQSSKALVATVEVLTRATCLEFGFDVNVNPQKRAALVSEQYIWVSPRRLDGAFPSLLNPVALWEIKEYWGGTQGGSKMSDAIYECQLVGQELRAFEDVHGRTVKHYVLLDGVHQWASRRADLRRAVDLVSAGLLDELIVGSDVLTDWPRIVRDLCLSSLEANEPSGDATPRPRPSDRRALHSSPEATKLW